MLDSGFLATAPSLLIQLMADDSYVQVRCGAVRRLAWPLVMAKFSDLENGHFIMFDNVFVVDLHIKNGEFPWLFTEIILDLRSLRFRSWRFENPKVTKSYQKLLIAY